ncbi:hypothetical protein HRI_000423000 [Hibiscus trionum]|uniref:Retrotransposon Copia-like N-terminal domain-containing protein n=1 Tax=Hibiscus trionum TaxID=183268 RepID=A0A9W7GXV0_HIBTR|nr:hypothetical protein HRI_000423000 [Hibiscus trionum]
MVSEVSMAESSSKSFTNKTITIRLNDTNYLLWKQHVLFATESLALTKHVDGSLVVSAQQVHGEGGTMFPNLDYVLYKQEDSALCSWLLSSIGSSILSALVNCKTALDIWGKIQHIFSVTLTLCIFTVL